MQTSETSPEHTFVRSRFLVKRLKKIRSRTKSLIKDLNVSDSFLSNGPSSLPLARSNQSVNDDEEEEEVNESFPSLSERDVCERDHLNISIHIRSKLEESLDYHSQTLQCWPSFSNDHGDSETNILEDVPINNEYFDTNMKKNTSFNLLEDIEEALPMEYSLKRSLFCFYSVTMYRAHQRLSRQPTNQRNDDEIHYSGARNKFGKMSNSIKEEILRLEFELAEQKMFLDQASKAMAVSTIKNYYHDQHIEAEKSYLIATIKHEAIEKEIERINKMQVLGNFFDKESGFANITKINICVEKPETLSSYLFMLVAVERDNVKSTELQKLEGESIDFENILQFHNLRYDFEIRLYLYGISILDARLKFLYRSTDRQNGNSKKGTNMFLNDVQSARHSFVLFGTAEIRVSHMQKKEFIIKSECENISRRITMNFKGDVYLDAQHSGFLDIRYFCPNNSKLSTMWSRYWFRLTGSVLQGWPYPSELTMKPPVHEIWLAQCISEDVKPVNDLSCLRPNVFTFYLTDKNENSHQVFCAADSVEEVQDWCLQLNKVIEYCRKWNVSIKPKSF